MDRGIRDRKQGISFCCILYALSSALAEWVVIFLLFFEGFISYLVRRFARYSNLHPPCLLCSNLDRILTREKEINLDDLICYEHKLEIATWIRDRGFDGIKPKLEREYSCDDQERLIRGESSFSQIDDNDPTKKEDRFMDHLPHIGYEEVKVTSDSDEEVDHEDFSSERERIAVPLVDEDSGLIPMDESEVVKPVEAGPTHGLEELNWNVIYEKDHSTSKLLPMYESSSNLDEAAILHAKNSKPTKNQLVQVSTTKDTNLPMLNHMDLNDAYKMAISYRMNHAIDAPGNNEDLKLVMSQICSSRSLEIPGGEIISGSQLHNLGEDLKPSDTSITTIQRNLSRKYSFERNESVTESLDGSSMISEIEGENQEDRMKRQLEIDRKSMVLLYKELEEERNASAISANQAMAMITRLQEEKAAMHMEALQYQRMMEEQSEYDQEAVQRLNDALNQKEAELEDAKAEVRRCRKLLEVRDQKGNERDMCKTSAFDFADEKQYISGWLWRLEKKILCPDHKSYADFGENDDVEPINGYEMVHEDVNSNLDQASSTNQQVNGSSKVHELDNGSEESNTSVEAQVLNLNERLNALEDDRSFLEHIEKSLRHDNDSIQLVREIASHLRELRQIRVKKRENI